MSDATPRPEAGESQTEELYGVSGGQVAAVRAALDANDLQRVEALCLGLHTADLADLIEELTPAERRIVIGVIGPRVDPELLTFLEEPAREDVVEQLGAADIAAAVTELETDDAVDVVASLEAPVKAEVLEQLDADERAVLEEALSLPEESAGRLMQREFVALPSHWTVGDTIDYLREEAERGAESLPDDFVDVFVVDGERRPVGVVSLSRIIRTQRPVRLADLMGTDIDRIPMATDQEEVANMFRQYDLASAPVVDHAGRLVGVITYDDVMDVIHDEAEEDIRLLAGVKEDDLYRAVLETSRSRLSWLFVSMLSSFTSAYVISHFQGTISHIVALAVLMPIAAALGGNAGNQTMTVAVRALAMKELNRGNALRILGKEILVGAVNGVLLAVLVSLAAGLWFDSATIGGVIATALIVNLLVAGTVGVLIPLTLNWLGADPAVASGVFVTTLTDVVGYSTFLGVATLVLL